MLQLIIIPAAALLLSGCQMLANHAAQTPNRVIIVEKGKIISDTATPSSSFANLGGMDVGKDLFVVPLSKVPAGTGAPLPAGFSKGDMERDIARISKLSKAKGGPTYSLLPDSCFLPDPAMQKALRSKKPVCYATQDGVGVPIATE